MNIILIFAVLFLGLCSCTSPQSKIYTIPQTYEIKAKSLSTNASVFLHVKAGKQLRQTYIIDKTSPYEMTHALNAKWEVPPDELIREYLAQALLKSELFKNVNSVRSATDERDYGLLVELRDFCRLKEASRFYASLTLDITLKTAQGKVLLQKTYSKKQVLKDDTYLSLAEAMTQILAETITSEILTDLQKTVSKP